MMLGRVHLLLLLPVWIAFGAPSPALAAPQPEPEAAVVDPDSVELTVELMEARLAQVRAAAEMDEALRARLVELYQQIIAELRKAAEFEGKRAELMRVQAEAPELMQALQAEAAAPLPDEQPEFPPDTSLAQLEQSLAEAERALKLAQDKASKHEQDLKELSERRKTTPEALSAANDQLARLDEEFGAAPPEGDARQVTEVRRILLRARRKALEAEIDRYETGIATCGVRIELHRLRQAQAAREATAKAALVKAWQDVVNERRRSEAETAAAEAERIRREKALSDRRVSREAEDNAKLAEERTAVTEKLTEASDRLVEIKRVLAEQTVSYDAIARRVRSAGLDQGVGMLLKRKRDALPDLPALQRESSDLQASLSATDIRLLELEEEVKKYADVEQMIRSTMKRIQSTTSAEERAMIEAELRPLLVSRGELMAALAKDLDTYFNKLLELVEQQRLLVGKVEEFSGFINERILWVRSATVPRTTDLQNAKASFLWITDRVRWRTIAAGTKQAVQNDPVPSAVFLLVFAFFLLQRRRLKRKITELGQTASRSVTSAFAPTAETLVLTLVVSAVWPSLLLFASWQLGRVPDAPSPAKSTAAGLQVAGLTFLFLEFLRQMSRPHGLAEAHFDWNARGLRLFRRHLVWLMAISLPLTVIFQISELSTWEASRSSMGRFAFILRTLAVIVFAQCIFRPSGGILQGTKWSAQRGRFNRVKHLWYPLAVGLPAVLVALSVLGYHYTAVRLAEQLRASILLLVLVLLVKALAMRWLLVSRRKLALEQLRKRREAQAQQAAERTGPPSDMDIPPEPEIDVSSISLQTRNLLRASTTAILLVGMWLVWVDVFPALRILNNYELWSRKVTVMESVTAADGAIEQKSVERRMPIRLGDLGLAVIVVVVTIVAAKNVPGLLEITILQRLPLDAGARYAVTTVSRYALTIVGIVVAFGRIGIGWSQVQWLAAAVTVGLGFGLQEIFANFVSGLIILFERPVRIGDVVTVGEVEGKVTRIRIRATTIMDWNRRELLVPNKEFITGKLMNWTLSDSVTREVISVGIAYGSDTELARKLLLKVADECPHVMKEPRPSAIFRRFGESTLDFDLRVFINERDDWPDLIDELHTSIDREFRRAGIEIAFPQRDIHIRTIAELPAAMQKAIEQAP